MIVYKTEGFINTTSQNELRIVIHHILVCHVKKKNQTCQHIFFRNFIYLFILKGGKKINKF